MKSARVGLTPEPMYIYSARPGSVSTSRAATLGIVQVNHILAGRFPRDQKPRPDFRARGRAWTYQALTGYLREGSILEAVRSATRLPLHYILSRLVLTAGRRLAKAASMRRTSYPE